MNLITSGDPPPNSKLIFGFVFTMQYQCHSLKKSTKTENYLIFQIDENLPADGGPLVDRRIPKNTDNFRHSRTKFGKPYMIKGDSSCACTGTEWELL